MPEVFFLEIILLKVPAIMHPGPIIHCLQTALPERKAGCQWIVLSGKLHFRKLIKKVLIILARQLKKWQMQKDWMPIKML